MFCLWKQLVKGKMKLMKLLLFVFIQQSFVNSAIAQPSQDAMNSQGNDGFSDCRKLCDPESGYQLSCRRYCADFTKQTHTNVNKHSRVTVSEILGITILICVVVVCVPLLFCYRKQVRERLCISLPFPVQETQDDERSQNLDLEPCILIDQRLEIQSMDSGHKNIPTDETASA